MRKNFGSKTWFYPLPVLIIGTYDEDGKANAMNAAWGGIYDENQVIICLSKDHKTTKNIMNKKEFTISFGDKKHVVECDYVGIVSGNNEKDKLAKAYFHTTKSEYVDAPIIDELPMCLECKMIKTIDDNIIAEIVNISIDEDVLNGDKVDINKLLPISYDPINHKYLTFTEEVGNAFSDGKKLK